jgi:hypothetical protein
MKQRRRTELGQRGAGPPVHVAERPQRLGRSRQVQAVQQIEDAMAVQQRLEQDEPVPARHDQLTDHRVRAQSVAVEGRLVALVVHRELR